ncbi:AraC family transcriptional regulator [Bacteroides acidifaciens]|uniref:helix-turn-helix domain-containing protein n=1 Tax=Bacteroides acidifaciens TaxID=85831 RepID=UPI0023D13736|nr:AraC family transcriptional regulator [Bacteroides acidifaciens]MDE6819754.1 AraC family transcriptional regulator [Bacteroides acidifaciens]
MRFLVCILVLLFVHNQYSRADKTIHNDSLYTEKYIRDIYISDSERALQLLDEAENKETISLRVINELRSLSYSNMYMNKLAFMYAKKAYLLDSIYEKDPEHMLKMTVYLAEFSSMMSKYNESMHYALEGIRQAQEVDNREAKARLFFCMGENNWRLSFKDKAYGYFNRTIELLRGSKEMREMMLLSCYYGAEMSFLMTDSRIDEALQVAFEREKLIGQLQSLPEIPDGYVDGQYSYLYAQLAYIYCTKKKYDKAEQYYQKYLSKKESHTPDGKMYSVPYLMLSGQYEKVIDNCRGFKELMKSQQDTLNEQYLTVLRHEVKAYLGMHKYKEVAEVYETILAITDSINTRDRNNAALELNAMYGVSEKEEYIAEQAFQLRIRNITLCFLACIVVLTLFVVWRLWHFNHIVEYKNRMLARLINERISNRKDDNRLSEAYEQLAVTSEIEPEVISSEEQEELNETDKVSGEEEENKKIFHELNRIVLQKQLYLSPELSREDLAQIVHLNNARFARMIRECTGTNFNGYINELRITYAIKLMKKYPNYTIRAIADESGFNSTPILYNLFKKKTGMTPYEFKKAQDSLRD